jgi:hypothetical protein
MTRFDLPRVRLRELERLLKERRGECVPLCEFLAPMARCFRQNLCNLGKPAEVADIAERFHAHHYEYPAPGFTKAHFEAAAIAAVRRPRLESADTLGRRLCLTDEERTLLGITTIGACDVTRAQRARRRRERKRQRDRQRAARKRAERGAIPRSQYLAESKARMRPWEAMGISQRTYYRRLKAAQVNHPGNNGTGPSPREKGGTGRSPTNLYNGLRPACATVWHGSKESGLPREDPLSGTDRARATTPVQRTGRRGTPDGVADADRPTRDGPAGLRP